ncbi:Lyzozyme M1 (1,4-beta-N-acetylmuramidase), GH25 family [Filimonas lacunae]|uniref:Lyzozyme M1 (1,4-beta-N-acetylmuramidase), GH25 family n=1 Tax=Filimonas lacunae TaxID=477680 RepID=A0A173MJB4_9BACT|nr:GH25 family lysozyme [Filimonas lacunae]BAV07704.1 1,4-beta-N-acetylmuramidase [Filimonas lacunae]SIT03762.1 Lyzozyme M1 (1,4-beta-N-acetylmuramidase), GH25 family [Filimonas lacunae]
MLKKHFFLLSFISLTIYAGAQGQKKPVKGAKPLAKDTSAKAFLYYALVDVKKMSSDTLFLEDDIYLYIDKEDGALYFKKYEQPAFPVPKSSYDDLSSFVFKNFLASDKYKVLERMAQMNGLLKNAKIGVDIANHQSPKPIDWKKVKADTANAGVSYVFIRSIRGYDNSYDPKFSAHYKEAIANGFPVGLYHNFVLNKTNRADFKQHALEQAKKFVESFQGKQIAFKPILDIEVHAKFAVVESQFTTAEIIEATKTFIDYVEKELKTDVIIYTFESFYTKYLKKDFDNKYIWIARYPHSQDFDTQRTYPGAKNPFLGISYDFSKKQFNYTLKSNTIGWQFSEDGIVDGIYNHVDMNIILNKDYDKWLWKQGN